jgi:hypothetical protein
MMDQSEAFHPGVYVKFFPKDLKLRDFQYSLGLNKDTKAFDPTPTCREGGLYYTSFKNMWDFISYGSVIGIIKIPKEVPIIAVYDDKFKSSQIFITETYDFVEFLKDPKLYPDEKFQDINAKNSRGWTALMFASAGGHSAIVELLLENGADIEAKGLYEWTALIYASRNGQKEIVELLLKKRDGVEPADINAKTSDGQTALMVASYHGYKEIVEILLNRAGKPDEGEPANIDAKDSFGLTALMYALLHGYKEIIKILENAAAKAKSIVKPTVINITPVSLKYSTGFGSYHGYPSQYFLPTQSMYYPMTMSYPTTSFGFYHGYHGYHW